jgi:hypothetical protein
MFVQQRFAQDEETSQSAQSFNKRVVTHWDEVPDGWHFNIPPSENSLEQHEEAHSNEDAQKDQSLALPIGGEE